jgi:hypothetical protein
MKCHCKPKRKSKSKRKRRVPRIKPIKAQPNPKPNDLLVHLLSNGKPTQTTTTSTQTHPATSNKSVQTKIRRKRRKSM